MAVGDERAQAARPGEGQRLAVVGLAPVGIEPVGARRDEAEQAQGTWLVGRRASAPWGSPACRT